jgi:hypothetical protein
MLMVLDFPRMQRFKVAVVSHNPEETRRALVSAPGISVFGAADHMITERPLAEHDALAFSSGHLMTTRLEADSAEAAEHRVREVVGGGCEVGPAEAITPPSPP